MTTLKPTQRDFLKRIERDNVLQNCFKYETIEAYEVFLHMRYLDEDYALLLSTKAHWPMHKVLEWLKIVITDNEYGLGDTGWLNSLRLQYINLQRSKLAK